MNENEIPTQEEIDAARHMADAVNLHVHAMLAENRDRPGYVAIRLADGKSPDGGVLYDTRKDATRHNLHDRTNFYVKVGKDTMPVREALIVLKLARTAFKRGVIFTEEEVITPHLTELLKRAHTLTPLKGRHDDN
jgi:hypothetical protein